MNNRRDISNKDLDDPNRTIRSGTMAASFRIRIAVAVAALAVGLQCLRSTPIWLTLLFAPIWIGAFGIGCLGLSLAARWYYDEALRKLRIRMDEDEASMMGRTNDMRIIWRDQLATPELDSLYMLDTDKGTAKGRLHQVLHLIQQDFVLPWYSRISKSSAFPKTLNQTILRTTANLETRFNGIDIPHLMVNKILPHVTKHMKDYRQVEPFFFPAINRNDRSDVLGKGSTVDPAPILQSHRKAPLHESLPAPSLPNPIPSIEAHLRRKVEKLLDVVLPDVETRSETVRIVVREVVTCAVLVPVVEMLADPDFWNRMLDQQADRHLQER
jgi:sorting nexin-25